MMKSVDDSDDRKAQASLIGLGVAVLAFLLGLINEALGIVVLVVGGIAWIITKTYM